MHPDRFIGDEAKYHAEERFKAAQELVPELLRYVQDEVVQLTPTELAPYKPVYDHVFTQAALDSALSRIEGLNLEIKDLERQVEWHKQRVDDLNTKLGDKKNDEFEAERLRLEKLYGTDGRTWASLGILIVLTGTMGIFTRIEEVSTKMRRYSPVYENVLNNCLFGIFLIILFFALKRFVENLIMKRRIREVCSVQAPIDFLAFLTRGRNEVIVEKFSEYEVYEFLNGPSRWWKRVLSLLGFVHYQIETSEQLKNFFISSLLKKELISISYAEGFNRWFLIRKRRGDWDI